ncbi:hypothetical protein SLS60_002189 [Paraconiothyrium brasiliense]|uniref:Uncharacterized protein n=1 Tax=Paraconiothyrium brasiliense TaxID=300254 RepID=A0ABR3S1G3_9PLEO
MSTLEGLQKDAISSIASVSTLLRNAIAAALPVAPEQYLTVAIPGTVVDLADYEQGGSFVYDVSKHSITPTTVRQNEARLVDGMMPVATIMIGNTGKSVARSYSRSLDALLPSKATISSVDGIRSPGNKNYDDAMKFLKTTPPGSKQTVVEIYRDKQLAWAKQRSAWDTAKIEVAKRAEHLFPPESGEDFIGKQKQYINEWNQENYYTYKASMQAAWMDWVVNGQKYNVEYNFGMIDIDSIMSRIEASKESLRNSTIPDADGSSEVYGVSLTPNRWATYCKLKAKGWYDRNGSYTLAQLEREIARLESLLASYTSAGTLIIHAKDKPATYPVAGAKKPTIDPNDTKQKVQDELAALYKTQAVLSGAIYNLEQVEGAKPPADSGDIEKAKGEVTIAQTAVGNAQKALKIAEDADQSARRSMNEYNRMVLEDTSLADAQNWFVTKKAEIQKEIDRLRLLRKDKAQKAPVDIPVISGVTAPTDEKDTKTPYGTALATQGSELANPVFKTPAAPAGDGTQPAASAEDADPWTTITFSYSASDLKTHTTESEWGMKVGGSVGFGLWSVGGSYSHDESHKSMQSDMAACDISVSFSALVVNINRPWLYGELFSDIDIEVAAGVNLSPGPLQLHQMIKEQKPDVIAMWSQFPAYPTSFIVAADTTIEFRGVTKHIEEHFDSHSNSGGASVGYGPWSVSSSFHESATEQSMQVHSTSTGCKISFGAPQVIAWVSQILPPLPRPQNYNPLSQGAGVAVPSATV